MFFYIGPVDDSPSRGILVAQFLVLFRLVPFPLRTSSRYWQIFFILPRIALSPLPLKNLNDRSFLVSAIMEESEKRRERLKAMRNEAAQGANADTVNTGSISQGLCNPLIESGTSSAPPQQSSPRFDFYTDPMSAFSAKTKRNNSSPPQGHTYPRPMYPDINRHPTYPNPDIRSPQERMIQASAVHYNQSPLPRPTEASNAMGKPQGNPPSAWGSDAAVNYNYPPNFSRPGNYGNPGFGHVDSPYSNYGRGRGNRYNNSTIYDSGRGRGRWQGNRGSPGSVSAEERPQSYYKKEMVQDPWKMLRAVIWKGFETSGSNKSRQSNFDHFKKAKVSSEHSHRSSTSQSQPSLAEYLASTVNESVIEAAAHEPTM